MDYFVEQDTLPGACGVTCFYEFTMEDEGYGQALKKIIPSGGIGLVCAGFREKEKFDLEVFEALCQRGKLVYRSPTRTNRNSGNKFFFAVFDFKKSLKSKYGFKDSGDEWSNKYDDSEDKE